MINLAQGEFVIMKVRRHWFIWVRELIALFVLLVMPFILFAANDFINAIPLPGDSLYLLAGLGSLWMLLVWILCFVFWTNYYLDLWIITNKHLMDLEQKSFFHREVSVVRLDRVQDVSIETKGLIRTLLKFGTIRVQSAGESTEFIMPDMSHPERLKQMITELVDKAEEESRIVRLEQSPVQ